MSVLESCIGVIFIYYVESKVLLIRIVLETGSLLFDLLKHPQNQPQVLTEKKKTTIHYETTLHIYIYMVIYNIPQYATISNILMNDAERTFWHLSLL